MTDTNVLVPVEGTFRWRLMLSREELVALVKETLDAHQQDAWVEIDPPIPPTLMRGDCSSTGDDGYEPHDRPFTEHQAMFVVGALESAGVLTLDQDQADPGRKRPGNTG